MVDNAINKLINLLQYVPLNNWFNPGFFIGLGLGLMIGGIAWAFLWISC